MNSKVFEYYQKNKNHFTEVILLDDETNLSFEKVKEMSPQIVKGWFELCRLSEQDRINFVCEFWQKSLPYSPRVNTFLEKFFTAIDDIGIFLLKKGNSSKYEAEMVYSFDDSFFRGGLPLNEENIFLLQKSFSSLLPEDFLAFLRIHNGFSKKEDGGIIKAENMKLVTDEMRRLIEVSGKKVYSGNRTINSDSLIFFYQDCGQNGFQCFYDEWCPNSEIGNVYFSALDFSISDYKSSRLGEKLAFTSFLEWLQFYFEDICIE